MLRRRGAAARTNPPVNEESADRVPATGRNFGKIVAWRRAQNCEAQLPAGERETCRPSPVAIADPGLRFAPSGLRSTIGRMLKTEIFPIADIYVPVKRRATLDPARVREIAESMLEVGQQTPILVRPDGKRFVLVEGLHRLEACKELGETTIRGYLVQARRH